MWDARSSAREGQASSRLRSREGQGWQGVVGQGRSGAGLGQSWSELRAKAQGRPDECHQPSPNIAAVLSGPPHWP